MRKDWNAILDKAAGSNPRQLGLIQSIEISRKRSGHYGVTLIIKTPRGAFLTVLGESSKNINEALGKAVRMAGYEYVVAPGGFCPLDDMPVGDPIVDNRQHS